MRAGFQSLRISGEGRRIRHASADYPQGFHRIKQRPIFLFYPIRAAAPLIRRTGREESGIIGR